MAGANDLPALDAGFCALLFHQLAEEAANLIGLLDVFQRQYTVGLVAAVEGHGTHAEQLLAQCLGAFDVENAVQQGLVGLCLQETVFAIQPVVIYPVLGKGPGQAQPALGVSPQNLFFGSDLEMPASRSACSQGTLQAWMRL